jgi:leucyl aminopeptidase
VEFSIKSGSPEKQRSACVVVGIFEPRKLTLAAELLDNAARNHLSDIIRRGDMEGKTGSTLLLHNVPGTLCDRVLLVGLGKEKSSVTRSTVTPYAVPYAPSTKLVRLTAPSS